jgi:hypothetical protein
MSPVGAPGQAADQSPLTARLEAALASTNWPKLVPSLDTVLAGSRPVEDNDGCGRTDLI